MLHSQSAAQRCPEYATRATLLKSIHIQLRCSSMWRSRMRRMDAFGRVFVEQTLHLFDLTPLQLELLSAHTHADPFLEHVLRAETVCVRSLGHFDQPTRHFNEPAYRSVCTRINPRKQREGGAVARGRAENMHNLVLLRQTVQAGWQERIQLIKLHLSTPRRHRSLLPPLQTYPSNTILQPSGPGT